MVDTSLPRHRTTKAQHYTRIRASAMKESFQPTSMVASLPMLKFSKIRLSYTRLLAENWLDRGLQI